MDTVAVDIKMEQDAVDISNKQHSSSPPSPLVSLDTSMGKKLSPSHGFHRRRRAAVMCLSFAGK
jgi:hypothetical protein